MSPTGSALEPLEELLRVRPPQQRGSARSILAAEVAREELGELGLSGCAPRRSAGRRRARCPRETLRAEQRLRLLRAHARDAQERLAALGVLPQQLDRASSAQSVAQSTSAPRRAAASAGSPRGHSRARWTRRPRSSRGCDADAARSARPLGYSSAQYGRNSSSLQNAASSISSSGLGGRRISRRAGRVRARPSSRRETRSSGARRTGRPRRRRGRGAAHSDNPRTHPTAPSSPSEAGLDDVRAQISSTSAGLPHANARA